MARQFDTSDTSPWSERFGYGVDGAKTVSASADYDGANASCSGTSGTTSVTLGAASTFANGDLVLIHQTRGTGAGAWELNRIASGGGGTSLTMSYSLQNTYTDSGASQAQMLELKQYSSVTVDSGQTWSAPAWDGDKGGILAFLCTGTTTVTGTISASAKGFRGGATAGENATATQGESATAAGSTSTAANGMGGGGSAKVAGSDGAGGGGGSYGASGTAGQSVGSSTGGSAGSTGGSTELTTITFGGGGGGGASTGTPGGGGDSGGLIVIISKRVTVSGAISANGENGTNGDSETAAAGGAGAGGAVLLKGQILSLGSALVTASGGTGGTTGGNGGDGGAGRIHADYSLSVSGTTSPTIDSDQDSILNDYGGGSIFAIAP